MAATSDLVVQVAAPKPETLTQAERIVMLEEQVARLADDVAGLLNTVKEELGDVGGEAKWVYWDDADAEEPDPLGMWVDYHDEVLAEPPSEDFRRAVARRLAGRAGGGGDA